MQVNIIKASVKGYKTLSVSVKQSKSKSITSKQNQINYKMIQNSGVNTVELIQWSQYSGILFSVSQLKIQYSQCSGNIVLCKLA